jgi:hypothetical protein
MEALELTVTPEPIDTGKWRLYPIGDVHIDLKTCDRARVAKYLQVIADDPHGVWIFVGDAVDGTTPSHRWYEPNWIRDEFVLDMEHYGQLCLDACEKLFEPLKSRPGVVMRGNHDFRKDTTSAWSGSGWTRRTLPVARASGRSGPITVRAAATGRAAR